MQIPTRYDHSTLEEEIYQRWLAADAFAAVPDGRDRRYVIMMPLPNVTGALHMGHAMDNVMQDLLIRWHRMRGDNSLWMPGTDHAGIATQAVVEKRLLELEGKTRHDIGRERLIQRIWDWKDQYQERIVKQQQRMGCSCDWERQRFTMDEVCTAAVRETFFRLFEDGLIYRGTRLVNWDCHLETAVSDDEIYDETVAGHFWHLCYPVIDPRPGEPEHVVVATTRPETMLGDTAVACHPDPAGQLRALIDKLRERLKASRDEGSMLEEELGLLEERQQRHLPRLEQLAEMARDGRKVRLPLQDREIPLILDPWAKPELGSGCVKITPAHDYNDYGVWQRHSESIGILNILNSDGTLNDNAGRYQGLDRFAARQEVVKDLEALGLVERIEDREVEIPHSDRSKTPIEPYLSLQWFVRMDDVEGGVVFGRGTEKEFSGPGLAQAAIDAVEGDWTSPTGLKLAFHPSTNNYQAIYHGWLVEKRDWCISRQLWWGHRIPIWHGPFSADLVTRLPSNEELCCRIAGPQGEQLTVTEAGRRSPEELAGYEIQVCPRSGEADERYGRDLADLGLTRDPDVLDTWFSSALWPHSTLYWPGTVEARPGGRGRGGEPELIRYYYPGSCLVTGRDIITLWVARMVILGLYNLGDLPFTDCFVHATVLDGAGVTMSKSKGNGIDPVDIIERYGADAMRYLICDMQTGSQYVRLPVQTTCPSYSPETHRHEHIELATAQHGRTKQGTTNLFTYICPECGQEFDVLGTMDHLPSATIFSERFDVGKKFCTKLWNAARFALMNLDREPPSPVPPDELCAEDRWILSRLGCAIATVDSYLEAYNPSAALAAIRDFFWSDLCDWYLEMIKPRVRSEREAGVARQVLATALDQVLRLLHPFVPFVTEAIWDTLNTQAPKRGVARPLEVPPLLVAALWPTAEDYRRDESLEAELRLVQEVIRGVRDLKLKHGVAQSKSLDASIQVDGKTAALLTRHREHILHMASLASVTMAPDAEPPKLAATQVIGEARIYLAGVLDPQKEQARLEKQRGTVQDQLERSRAKLANERFLKKAPPHVVEAERTRASDLLAQLQVIDELLTELVDP